MANTQQQQAQRTAKVQQAHALLKEIGLLEILMRPENSQLMHQLDLRTEDYVRGVSQEKLSVALVKRVEKQVAASLNKNVVRASNVVVSNKGRLLIEARWERVGHLDCCVYTYTLENKTITETELYNLASK